MKLGKLQMIVLVNMQHSPNRAWHTHHTDRIFLGSAARAEKVLASLRERGLVEGDRLTPEGEAFGVGDQVWGLFSCEMGFAGGYSDHLVSKHDSSDDAYRRLMHIEQFEDGHFVGRVIAIRECWEPIVGGVRRGHRKVWTDTPPYPRHLEADMPAFYREFREALAA